MPKIKKEPVKLTTIGRGVRAQEDFFASLTPENAIPRFVFMQGSLLDEAPNKALAAAHLLIVMIEGAEQYEILQGAEAMLAEADLCDQLSGVPQADPEVTGDIEHDADCEAVRFVDDIIESLEAAAAEGRLEVTKGTFETEETVVPFGIEDEDDLEDLVASYLCDPEDNKDFFETCLKALMLHVDDRLVREFISSAMLAALKTVGIVDQTYFVDFMEAVEEAIEDFKEEDPILCGYLATIANMADDDMMEQAAFDAVDEEVEQIAQEVMTFVDLHVGEIDDGESESAFHRMFDGPHDPAEVAEILSEDMAPPDNDIDARKD